MPDLAVRSSEMGQNFNSWPICCSSNAMSYFRRIDANATFTANLAILIPMQARGPSPKGKYGMSTDVLPDLFSLENRAGSKWFGFG